VTRWAARAILGLLFVGSLAALADARPGGGHSFSGGGGGGGRSYRSSSSSSSGGGGSDDGTGVIVFVVLVGIVVAIGVSQGAKNPSAASWTSSMTFPTPRAGFKPLLAKDPAFSQTAFEDFAFQLYARAQRARSKPAELAALTPYLTQDVIAAFTAMRPVDTVVIGSLRVVHVGTASLTGDDVIDVRIEANLANFNGTSNTIERWTFARMPNVKSRAPDKTKTFPCPNCGAPFTAGSAERVCSHCDTNIGTGKFDWIVVAASIGTTSSVGLTLTGTVAEIGTDYVTRVEDDAYAQMQALYNDDKNVNWDAFSAHVTMTYQRLNTAWNSLDLTPVRGLVTHSLLGYLQFWVDEYKRQRLANKLDGATVSRIALAKVLRDSFYDAVTVRVFADGFDYTIDAEGKVVGGSKTSRRAYTEYWTFIRSSTRRGPITVEPKCPNCGAPLSISNAGACTHCNAEIESGSFDWVLSKIEQDEVYFG